MTRKAAASNAAMVEWRYENPPIADTEHERILRGIYLHNTREWDVRKCANKSGVQYDKLYR